MLSFRELAASMPLREPRKRISRRAKLLLIMEQLPGSSTARDSTQSDRVRLIRVSVQPKTWFGKLVAGIAALALLVVGFFVSLVLFAIAACIGAAAIVYFLWARRRARRAMRDRVIDGEVKSRDIR